MKVLNDVEVFVNVESVRVQRVDPNLVLLTLKNGAGGRDAVLSVVVIDGKLEVTNLTGQD